MKTLRRACLISLLTFTASPASAFCPMGYTFLGDHIVKGQLPWEYCGKPVLEHCTELLITGALGAPNPATGRPGLATRAAVVENTEILPIRLENRVLAEGHTDEGCNPVILYNPENEFAESSYSFSTVIFGMAQKLPVVFPQFSTLSLP